MVIFLRSFGRLQNFLVNIRALERAEIENDNFYQGPVLKGPSKGTQMGSKQADLPHFWTKFVIFRPKKCEISSNF
jgi:hypothetical protein